MIKRRLGYKQWTAAEKDILREHYPDKGSILCSTLIPSKTPAQIVSKAIRMKIGLNPDRLSDIVRYGYDDRARRFREKREAYIASVDWTKYIELNDETIYLLGYIWADGSVSKRSHGYYQFSFSIAESDANDIKETMKRFGCPIKLNTGVYVPRRPNEQPMRRWTSGRWEVGHWFALYDYHIKSWSMPTKILGLIPCDKHYLFFRGYSDGDGHILRDKHHFSWGVSSTCQQDWAFMKEALTDIGVTEWRINATPRPKGCTSTFNIRYCQDALKWCRYIYQGCETDGIGLKRKRVRFLEENRMVRPRSGLFPRQEKAPATAQTACL